MKKALGKASSELGVLEEQREREKAEYEAQAEIDQLIGAGQMAMKRRQSNKPQRLFEKILHVAPHSQRKTDLEKAKRKARKLNNFRWNRSKPRNLEILRMLLSYWTRYCIYLRIGTRLSDLLDID